MIIGVGTDIVEIDRIEKAIKSSSCFLEKIFSQEELQYLKSRKLSAQSAAGGFAAKEAVSKALGTGFRGFSIKDIVILRNELGKPYVILKGKAEILAKRSGKYSIHLSISHERKNAIAFAVLEVLG